MTAARTGNADAVQVLVARGADVNAREGWRGQTALMWAAAENNAAAIRVLAGAGADLRASRRPERSRRCCSRYAAATSTRRARCSTPGADVNERLPTA